MKPLRWEIENFATTDFCQNMIDYAEEVGFEKATITTPAGDPRAHASGLVGGQRSPKGYSIPKGYTGPR